MFTQHVCNVMTLITFIWAYTRGRFKYSEFLQLDVEYKCA